MARRSEALLALLVAVAFAYALSEAARTTEKERLGMRQMQDGMGGLYVPTESGWVYVRARDFGNLSH